MANLQIIDSHLHTGIQNVSWRWEDIRRLLLAAGVTGAGVIPPVEDIYDRNNYRFQDNQEWQACRRRAHRYLLDLKDPEIELYPYFFVWNDFACEDLGPEFVAIKWHRHGNEPEYHYGDPRCREFLAAVKDRGLPILLEETLANTVMFLEKLAPDIPVAIPHLGALNGGYDNLRRAGVWNLPNVYADSALADLDAMEDYLGRHGSGRLMFGSDYPFSSPEVELAKIRGLNLSEPDTRAILGDNFRRLCRQE
jgi:hypothetical protein